MNEQHDFEHLVADQLSRAGVGMPPESAIEDTITRAGGTRRLPEWLALIKESPMRTNNHLAVGSPTVRVAVVMAMTLLLAVALAAAGAGAQRLLAANGPIVVAQDGSGTFTSIGDAVAAAEDGDEILVRPGTYAESVAVVGKDITLRGDGLREDIVIEGSTRGSPPTYDLDQHAEEGVADFVWAVLFADTASALSGVTVVTPEDEEAIIVVGSKATADLDDVVVRSLGDIRGGINAVFWREGAGGSLRNSLIEGWVGLNQDANVVVEGNEMPATCLGVWEAGANAVIRDNVIHGCPFEKGIEVWGENTALIEGNEIWVEVADPGPPNSAWGGRVGISVEGNGVGPVTIRDNDIHDSLVGIQLTAHDAESEVTGNQVRDNQSGINALIAGSTTISGNTITGSSTSGLEVRDSDAIVEDNTITDNRFGLTLRPGATPTLSGNTICDNATNVVVNPSGDAPDLSGNEVCEDTATE